ncbi:hypothetical protein DMA15_00865 [Streptomyces sp. WAC 01529]|nr:hypothetical protein DMA15_00865 [Streptomyces sp. WAC 01529]
MDDAGPQDAGHLVRGGRGDRGGRGGGRGRGGRGPGGRRREDEGRRGDPSASYHVGKGHEFTPGVG